MIGDIEIKDPDYLVDGTIETPSLIGTLIQLVEGCNTRFVSPIALSNFAKKELEGYPEKLPVYLKNAFLSGAYALAKG